MRTTIEIPTRLPFALGAALITLAASACAVGSDSDSGSDDHGAPSPLGEATEAVSTLPLHAGVGTVGTQSSTYTPKLAETSFSTPFSSPPLLFATTSVDSTGPGQVFATTGIGTVMGAFDVAAYREDSPGAAWTSSLSVGWLGIPSTNELHTQAGLCSVGPNSTGNYASVTVKFNQAFGNVPRIVLTPQGYPYTTSFAMTTTAVSVTDFTANIIRADWINGPWGQDVQFNWLAWDSDADLSTAGGQSGTLDVGSSSAATHDSLLYFSPDFPPAGPPPIVIITPHGSVETQTFAVTIGSPTTTGSGANFMRLDSAAGWTQDLHADWIALPAQ
jgi:hypothetical protein